MRDQLVGLAVSVATYLAGAWLFVVASRRRIDALPAEWRYHESLRETYDEALRWSWRRSIMRWPERVMVAWFVVLFAGFLLLGIGGPNLVFELVVTIGFAVYATGTGYERARLNAATVREEYDLPPSAPNISGRIEYAVSSFVSWLGFGGIACFLAGVLAEALG